MADTDLELGGGVVLLALPAFLPSVISSFFTQNRGTCPFPRSAIARCIVSVVCSFVLSKGIEPFM